ncbi:MAG: hypothetical protein IJ029_03425 [Lachnospiraceae bacterium]|nr:hypothetical protein [Lachnospiraceae bacterium]
MGKLVCFWSPYAGHGKGTSSLCAVLGGFVLQHPELNIAVSYTQKGDKSLIKKLDGDVAAWNDNGWLDSFGIGTLKMFSRQNTVSTDYIRHCGLSVSDKELFFYPNVSWGEPDDRETFELMTKHLPKAFDIAFLDLESGDKERAVQYMEAADYVIVVLPQEPLYAEKFLQENSGSFAGIDFGIIFGGCISSSQYRSAFYKKRYGKKTGDRILGEILWNADYFEAMSAGKTIDFFFRNNMPVKKEENYEFISQVKKTTERIREKLVFS